ncbi:helix-turn-helix domain-containing protein [Chryseobacterium sp. CKR4-1]|uniref:helix-turn-helix domain-containing protein n=1 Tax=Chryseobacterium sp. CKR4-1 TaxID=3068896 RepID=UPI0027969190|nr:helix-turn-helix domain-containing protein [Chryseobacterium sp. CKR4-1]MDQ1805022.1 helix-turn-helix domain-containing protein [Chryseobacterium sp. CKR4-1]
MCELLFAQQQKLSDFYLIQRQYENLPENDVAALPLVGKLICKAKLENNQKQLFLGYKDARYYSAEPQVKLKYADSAIYVAKAIKNDSLLSSAYMSKGVVYYFYLKKYKLALNEYLKAFEKNKSNKDPYYRNKLNYHIGVVKSYIGYYREALNNFEEGRAFFEGEIKKYQHPNLMYGNQRGYLNTIHQMAVCYRKLDDYKRADSLIAVGLAGSSKNGDYRQEQSYFLTEEGIREFRNKHYSSAVKMLNNSLSELIQVNDFAWLTVSYSYLGRAKWEQGNTGEAIRDFEKIDSIFVKHNFVLPEVRHIYVDLINYYADKKDNTKSLYYSRQLLKVDKILEEDFVYLSSKIHQEYDADKLLQEKDKLQRISWIRGTVYMIILFIFSFGAFYLLLRLRSRKTVTGRNSILGINLAGGTLNMEGEGAFRIRTYRKTDIGNGIVEDVLKKLSEFEANHEYLNEHIKLKSMAKSFGVNHNYLSEIIQAHRGTNFHLYLCELRISYITEKLDTDREYHKYTSETLAKMCGISSRTNFSKVFLQINGMNFTQYLHKVKSEMGGASISINE